MITRPLRVGSARRSLNVEHDDVDPSLGDEPGDIGAVFRLRDNVHARDRRQQTPESTARHGFVIDDHDAHQGFSC